MDYTEDYKGHSFTVSTRQVGRGYMWSYVIDADIYREQRGDSPQSEEIALHDGVGEAKFYIDQMTKAK